MSKDPTYQKRDFFRFESTLTAFIMPLDGKNPSNAGLLEGFLSLANSPLLNEVASLQATWRACLRENQVYARDERSVSSDVSRDRQSCEGGTEARTRSV